MKNNLLQKSKQNSFLGQAGELLVCFDFVVRGFEAVINPFPGAKADVLAQTTCGRVIRCQVKSTGAPIVVAKSGGRGAKTSRKYKFGLGGGSYTYDAAGVDLFAFVALDVRKTLYLTAQDLFNGNDRDKKAFGLQSFAAQAEGSLERCLAALVPA